MIHVAKQFTAEDRRAARALFEPQPEHERWDLDVRMAFQCHRCHKFAYGPRRFMREAIQEHWATSCPARHTKADAPMEARILVPKQ